MALLGRLLAALPLLILSPFTMFLSVCALGITDLFWSLVGKRLSSESTAPPAQTASVVIPNWNGRDLLEKYLPSVVTALAGNPQNEIIVVDDGSTDGSVQFLREHFPQVKVVALTKNLGFGGGSNAGFRAARNRIVVLLNSDMRVAPDFLQPLLEGFTGNDTFAVSCHIFFSDPAKLREETGLTEGWWENGRLRVRHRIDEEVKTSFPCFYGGGGSCAFDRDKFLELGGFDHLLAPFYLEDTDLGYMAWKRGWKVLFEPRSIVYHEHRGTIGKKFTQEYIQSILRKNFVLFCWKNVHEWPRLLSHFFFAYCEALLGVVFGDSPERTNLRGLWRAFLQLPQACASRWRARSLAAVSDTEAFRRPLAGYFRDRFLKLPADPATLRVLFVSPYPICPPVHGGGVFMYQTSMELARFCDLHLIALLDYPQERKAHEELANRCASAEFLLRMKGSHNTLTTASPHAISEFRNADLAWLIHRQIYTKQIDVLQLEYLTMGQYAGAFRQIPCILFEHDIYFQSIGRQLGNMPGIIRRTKATLEYLKALHYELGLLPTLDRVQVCSRDNRDHLLSFLPELRSRVDDSLRAGIDTTRYDFRASGRQPATMLFLGSFRHLPNKEALEWFTRSVLPIVLKARPEARLVVIGSDPPPKHSLPGFSQSIELHGFVEDVRTPLAEYAVFICPILSGSGVRVKLLEAFAAGIPVVSTTIGAEGLAAIDGEICALADEPQEFAGRILHLFDHPEEAEAMAIRAREDVVRSRDMRTITTNLERSYREAVERKRGPSTDPAKKPAS
ncbi:MAG: glycosyltransferase [Bryobacteraceae bacterium]